jgi:hypothetical protein
MTGPGEKEICDDICRYFDRILIDAHVRYEADLEGSYRTEAALDGYGDVERLGPALLALRVGRGRGAERAGTVAGILEGSYGHYDFSFSYDGGDGGVWCHFQYRHAAYESYDGFVPLADFGRVFGAEALTGEVLDRRISGYLEGRGAERSLWTSCRFTCRDYLAERGRDGGPPPAGLGELDAAGGDPALLAIYEFSLAAHHERAAHAARLERSLGDAESGKGKGKGRRRAAARAAGPGPGKEAE